MIQEQLNLFENGVRPLAERMCLRTFGELLVQNDVIGENSMIKMR